MENVIRVIAKDDGTWLVQPKGGPERHHKRKAVAALDAKLKAANGDINGRVVFQRVDGSIELERTYNTLHPHQP